MFTQKLAHRYLQLLYSYFTKHESNGDVLQGVSEKQTTAYSDNKVLKFNTKIIAL